MNEHIWTASGTDITLRWRKAGWIPPSEIQSYKEKWKHYQELPLRSLDEQGKIAYEGTLKLNKIFRDQIMATKLKVLVPAIKEKSGKVIVAKSKAYSHDDLKKMAGKEAKHSKHEFELSNGRIVTRKVAAKVAEKAGEVPKSVGKKLHSHDLRRAEGIKKKESVMGNDEAMLFTGVVILGFIVIIFYLIGQNNDR